MLSLCVCMSDFRLVFKDKYNGGCQKEYFYTLLYFFYANPVLKFFCPGLIDARVIQTRATTRSIAPAFAAGPGRNPK